jgi:hypothetical protein
MPLGNHRLKRRGKRLYLAHRVCHVRNRCGAALSDFSNTSKACICQAFDSKQEIYSDTSFLSPQSELMARIGTGIKKR